MNLIILSRNPNLYSTHSLAQAAIKRNHNLRIINPLECEVVIEKNESTIQYQGKKIGPIDAVIPRIGASITGFGNILIKQFEAMKVYTCLSSEALSNSRNKVLCLQKLAAAGLGVPKTVFLHQSQDPQEAIKKIGGFPLIIKLVEGTQGLGVVIADSQNAAESMLDAFSAMRKSVIIQEFIKEASGSDIRVFVVDGKISGAIRRQGKEGEFRSNLHRGGSARVAILSEEEKQAALKAVDILGLNIAGVDMLRSKNGPLILEVNSSPGLEGIEYVTKKDIAKDIIKFVEKSVGK